MLYIVTRFTYDPQEVKVLHVEYERETDEAPQEVHKCFDMILEDIKEWRQGTDQILINDTHDIICYRRSNWSNNKYPVYHYKIHEYDDEATPGN